MTFSLKLLTEAAVLAVLLSACSTDTTADDPQDSASAGPVAFGHVHGLGINPADNRLYVASHLGVFRSTRGGFERVADRWQDTMAFTVTGDDAFLASGHPDLRETDRPIQLGLIKSTDAAESWEALSLEGEADFHALEPAADLVYGYDSSDGVLKVTRDEQTWTDLVQVGVIDLAVNPEDANDLLVTDNRTQLQRLVGTTRLKAVSGAPALAFIDWSSPDLLVGVAGDGTVHRSRDGGSSWETLGSVGRAPEALAVTPNVWHVATERGVLSSRDDGHTWTPVPGQPRMGRS